MTQSILANLIHQAKFEDLEAFTKMASITNCDTLTGAFNAKNLKFLESKEAWLAIAGTIAKADVRTAKQASAAVSLLEGTLSEKSAKEVKLALCNNHGESLPVPLFDAMLSLSEDKHFAFTHQELEALVFTDQLLQVEILEGKTALPVKVIEKLQDSFHSMNVSLALEFFFKHSSKDFFFRAFSNAFNAEKTIGVLRVPDDSQRVQLKALWLKALKRSTSKYPLPHYVFNDFQDMARDKGGHGFDLQESILILKNATEEDATDLLAFFFKYSTQPYLKPAEVAKLLAAAPKDRTLRVLRKMKPIIESSNFDMLLNIGYFDDGVKEEDLRYLSVPPEIILKSYASNSLSLELSASLLNSCGGYVLLDLFKRSEIPSELLKLIDARRILQAEGSQKLSFSQMLDLLGNNSCGSFSHELFPKRYDWDLIARALGRSAPAGLTKLVEIKAEKRKAVADGSWFKNHTDTAFLGVFHPREESFWIAFEKVNHKEILESREFIMVFRNRLEDFEFLVANLSGSALESLGEALNLIDIGYLGRFTLVDEPAEYPAFLNLLAKHFHNWDNAPQSLNNILAFWLSNNMPESFEQQQFIFNMLPTWKASLEDLLRAARAL